jgi:hypothetical protein
MTRIGLKDGLVELYGFFLPACPVVLNRLPEHLVNVQDGSLPRRLDVRHDGSKWQSTRREYSHGRELLTGKWPVLRLRIFAMDSRWGQSDLDSG